MVTIVPDTDGGTLGTARPLYGWDDEDSLKGYLISLVAGYVAEMRLAPHCESEIQGGAGRDLEEAEELIGKNLPDDTLRIWIELGEQFVAENWSAIELVAKALLEYKTLQGDEVDILVDEAMGDADAGAHARFRTWRESASS